MGVNIFANITQKGTLAAFHQAMETYPSVYDKHCMKINSTTKTEQYVWPGFLPTPREFISGRTFQGIRDFTVSVSDKTYELSFLIDRESVEDDQHGFVNARIAEAAEVLVTFKDAQFAALLEAGSTSTATFDGTAFYAGTRVVGGSANIDNNETSNITDPAIPTVAEWKAMLQSAIDTISQYQDDQGRPMNAQAISQLRLIGKPSYKATFVETTQATLTGGGDSNPYYYQLAQFDMLPYLTSTTYAVYLSALGSTRKPFIYQERTPPEIVVFNDSNSVALNNGVMVLARQRYRFGYGDPRRSILWTFT